MSSFSLVHGDIAHGREGVAPPVGVVYDAVLVAAQAGAEWAWMLLYRSVAPALLGLLRAGGDPHPTDTLGEVIVELARGVRTFGGDEHTFRVWAFAIAHRHLVANRAARPMRRSGSAGFQRDAVLLTALGNFSAAEVGVILGARPAQVQAACTAAVQGLDDNGRFLASLDDPPAVPALVEHTHVSGAARAAVTGTTAAAPPPPHFRQLRPHRRTAALLPALAAMFAGAGTKTALAAAVALAGIGGTLAIDALPQATPAEARPAFERAADKATQPIPARGAPPLSATAGPRSRSPRAEQARATAAAAKAAGLAKATQARSATARGSTGLSGQGLGRMSLPPLPRERLGTDVSRRGWTAPRQRHQQPRRR